MRRRSSLVIPAAALTAIVLAGCSAQQTQRLTYYRVVDVKPVSANAPYITATAYTQPVYLGASDEFGGVVYEQYLAYLSRQDQMHATVDTDFVGPPE